MIPDEKHMRRALTLAGKGLGFTSPNPPVGAVIVDENEMVLGEGWHRGAGQAHAEVLAIEDARRRFGEEVNFDRSTLYVTLEPCSTRGRTGACTDAILEGRFRRVVIGTADPNPKHSGAAISILRNRGVEVECGCLESKATDLIRFFAKHVTTGRPYLIAKSAITLDGRTTLRNGDGPWISSKESRRDVQRWRRRIDAILIGGETLRRDNPRLTLRGAFAKGRPQPWRIVLSQSGDLPEEAYPFTDSHRDRTRVFVGESLEAVLDRLGAEGVTSAMLESGGRLFGAALSAGLIDEIILYVAPFLGGGSTGLGSPGGFLADLESPTFKRFGNDIRVIGRPRLRPLS